MDNTYIALKKILNMMVPQKYAMVLDIQVIDDSYYYVKNYIIYLGVVPNDLELLRSSDIREYVKDVSRYVLKGHENIQIIFYNPEDW